jgi:Uma2 family endonuclease
MQDKLTIAFDQEWLEEEDMPDNSLQDTLVFYLRSVLKWLYRLEDWAVPGNFLLIKANVGKAAPDIAVLKGYTNLQRRLERPKSWVIDPPKRPAPPIVFEISSESTWQKDLDEKVVLYGQMGVKEYFAYDPDSPRTWVGRPERLLGWRYADGQPQELAPDQRGWLWSEEIESWLVPDGQNLWLYTAEGQARPSESEAADLERVAKEVAHHQAKAAQAAKKEARQQAKAERAAKELAQQQAEAERIARETAQQQADLERMAKEAAQAELEAIRAKLRARNLDLDEL